MLISKLKDIFYEVVTEHDPDGCNFASGYCMDLAQAFGTFLEDIGLETTYWSYETPQEPQVHIGVEAEGVFFDSSFTWDKHEASGLGDFYVDSGEPDWIEIPKESIVGGIKNPRSSELYQDFKKAFREFKYIQ